MAAHIFPAKELLMQLLALCLYRRAQAPEKASAYQAQPGVALGLLVADTARKPWEITVLAVAPAVRGLGLGRALIHYAQAQAGQAGLCAETDADAAGFYGRCGFSIVSLGENIPTYRAIAAC